MEPNATRRLGLCVRVTAQTQPQEELLLLNLPLNKVGVWGSGIKVSDVRFGDEDLAFGV